MLVTYSSDGTPLRTKARFVVEVSGYGKVRRPGGATKEYLVQQRFIRYMDTVGTLHAKVVLRGPRQLTEGK
eukprot:11210324-Lingulodinium_polyedra.AAC.1